MLRARRLCAAGLKWRLSRIFTAGVGKKKDRLSLSFFAEAG
jgi:hypothetical protein